MLPLWASPFFSHYCGQILRAYLRVIETEADGHFDLRRFLHCCFTGGIAFTVDINSRRNVLSETADESPKHVAVVEANHGGRSGKGGHMKFWSW